MPNPIFSERAPVACRRQRTYRPEDPELLSRSEAAMVLGVSRSTMNQWAMRHAGPAFVRLGKSCWYRRSDLQQWIAQQRRSVSELPA
jgi:excisionase family DNA binding protein